MTAIDSQSYLSYSNKLVDQFDNTYHHSIGKKPTDSAMPEKVKTNPKAPKLKV